MGKRNIGIDWDFDGNKLLNMGEESVSPIAVITPASFSTNQNNYNPTDLGIANVLRLITTSNVSITGITAPDTARNKKLILFNAGGSNITLTDASPSSTAVNRFEIGGNLVMNPNESCMLFYDQISQRWRKISQAI